MGSESTDLFSGLPIANRQVVEPLSMFFPLIGGAVKVLDWLHVLGYRKSHISCHFLPPFIYSGIHYVSLYLPQGL
jgi:hypothetical protein